MSDIVELYAYIEKLNRYYLSLQFYFFLLFFFISWFYLYLNELFAFHYLIRRATVRFSVCTTICRYSPVELINFYHLLYRCDHFSHLQWEEQLGNGRLRHPAKNTIPILLFFLVQHYYYWRWKFDFDWRSAWLFLNKINKSRSINTTGPWLWIHMLLVVIE